jgi:hypothetical protein
MEPQPGRNDEFWREFLQQGGDTWQGIGRRFFKRIPADPRCRMCAAPFRGPGGTMMRALGKRQSDARRAPAGLTSAAPATVAA